MVAQNVVRDLQAAIETAGQTDNRLATALCGVALDNPVIPASGTFGYGREFAALYDIRMLGSFSFKGTTTEPRVGNPTPRIAETPCGMLNSVGLQNPGMEAVLTDELPWIADPANFGKPVMANISGYSLEEYATLAAAFGARPEVGWLEVNISCPNFHGGGMAFGTSPEAAASVCAAVKAVTDKPVIMKLSPNVTDIVQIAKACEAAGADGIALINTLLGMRINLKSRRPIIANKVAGFSGAAVFPVALRMVWQVANAVQVPVVGLGGVTCARDVIEMMMAGAVAVEVGTANLIEPFACKRIIEELPQVMDELGIEKLTDVIGVA